MGDRRKKKNVFLFGVEFFVGSPFPKWREGIGLVGGWRRGILKKKKETILFVFFICDCWGKLEYEINHIFGF